MHMVNCHLLICITVGSMLEFLILSIMNGYNTALVAVHMFYYIVYNRLLINYCYILYANNVMTYEDDIQ